MRIGKFTGDESTIRFHLELACVRCGKKVPGGIVTSENYFGSYAFLLEIDELKKNIFAEIVEIKKEFSIGLSIFLVLITLWGFFPDLNLSTINFIVVN